MVFACFSNGMFILNRQVAFFFVLTPVFAVNVGEDLPSFFFRNTDRSKSGPLFILNSAAVHASFSRDSVAFWSEGHKTDIHFVLSRAAALEPALPAEGHANFLIGQNRGNWRTGIEIYSKIRYRELYPAIDLEYFVTSGHLKSQFIVSPGGDPRVIRIAYSALGTLSIEPDGSLLYRTREMELREGAPKILQGGRRVEGRYRLLDDHTAGFEIGDYDPRKMLVIDPVVSYCTYLGGSGISAVTGVARDNSGNQYLTGYTEASNFPVAGAIQPSNHGGVDAFVAKLNAAGTAILYATYLGGYGEDAGAAISVDAAGEAVVAGFTASTNFPLSSPIRATLGGGRDGFIVKLNAAGNGLVYSTYFGGSGWDQATAVALDSAGDAYVAGDTQSTDFPVLSGPQAAFGGATDAFVAELSPAGTALFSTYLGGLSAEHAAGIAVDSIGNAYVAGGTYSSNFPAAGALQSSDAGSEDAFVTKLTASAFLYSTFLGGSGQDQANAIAVDSSGNAYVGGITSSSNFPATAGALRPVYNNMGDAFVAKLNPAGSGLAYATYFGGSASNSINGIAVDAAGEAYVVGATTSWDFPAVNAIQPTLNGRQNAFLAELNTAGSKLILSTYYGGSGEDAATAIALDSSNIYVGGQTSSSDFPVVNPEEAAWDGAAMGWAMKLPKTVPRREPPRDFLGNGKSDVLLYSPGSGTAYTALSNESGTFDYTYNLWTPGFDTIVTGDWMNSGQAGVVVYSSSSGLAYAGRSNGDGTFQFAGVFWSPGYGLVIPGDWNGDGKTDLILYRPTDGTMYTLVSQSSSTISFSYHYSLVTIGLTAIAVGDFNADGNSDILLYRASDGMAYLGLSNGIGTFTYYGVFLSPGYDVQVADFNADGKTDVFLYNTATGAAAVGLSTGSSFTFSARTYPGGCLARTGDFNGDGFGDILLYNPSNGSGELGLGYGDGTFNLSALSWTAGYTAVIPQDLNGDGKTDVVLYNRNSGAGLTGLSNGSIFSFVSSFWGANRILGQ